VEDTLGASGAAGYAQIQTEIQRAEDRRSTPSAAAISARSARPRALSTMGQIGLPQAAARVTWAALSALGNSTPVTLACRAHTARSSTCCAWVAALTRT